MTPVEHTPETATDPALAAVLPAAIAGHLARLCEAGFPVNWTHDAGDLPFTGVYDARSSDDRIYVDIDEHRLLGQMDSLGDHEDPDYHCAYEYWVHAVGLSRTSRTLARVIRTAVVERDSAAVRANVRKLRDLASTIQRGSDAHGMLVAVCAHFDA